MRTCATSRVTSDAIRVLSKGFTNKRTNMALDIIKYERNWIDGINRGDVSYADESFAPNCIIHMVGAPEPNLSVSAFKELIAGLLVAFPDLHVTVEDQIISG